MEELLSMDLSEIQKVITEYGQPAFRAKQLFKWLNSGSDYSEMTDMPLDLRNKLMARYIVKPIVIFKKMVSQDGTVKFLYKLSDDNIIEGVLMKYSYGYTLCVSTQVGCRMGCAFCASTVDGLKRNLSAGEILGQVIEANRYLGGTVAKRMVTNIVLMGSGEPLDNYDNVTKFLKLVNSEQGLNISQRNISLSTCGIAPMIRKLADDGFSVTLSISLHATQDEARAKIMPIANKYTINEVLESAQYYFDKTGRRIAIEYSMIKGENVNFFDAKRLYELLKRLQCHVNLIMLNSVKEKDLNACTKEEAQRFKERLEEYGMSVTIRRSMGSDIEGACGQLRRKFLTKADNNSTKE